MCGLRYVTILTWPICVLQIADLNEAGSALAEELGASKARFIKTSVTERGAMRCGEARVACASVFHLSCVPNAGPQARCRLRLTLPFPRLAGSMASFIALAWVRRCGVSRSPETRRGATGVRAGSGRRTHRHADALCANMAADMSLVVGLCAFDARRTCAARASRPRGTNSTLSSPRSGSREGTRS